MIYSFKIYCSLILYKGVSLKFLYKICFFVKPQNWVSFLNEIEKLKINYFLVKFDNSGLKVWESDYD